MIASECWCITGITTTSVLSCRKLPSLPGHLPCGLFWWPQTFASPPASKTCSSYECQCFQRTSVSPSFVLVPRVFCVVEKRTLVKHGILDGFVWNSWSSYTAVLNGRVLTWIGARLRKWNPPTSDAAHQNWAKWIVREVKAQKWNRKGGPGLLCQMDWWLHKTEAFPAKQCRKLTHTIVTGTSSSNRGMWQDNPTEWVSGALAGSNRNPHPVREARGLKWIVFCVSVLWIVFHFLLLVANFNWQTVHIASSSWCGGWVFEYCAPSKLDFCPAIHLQAKYIIGFFWNWSASVSVVKTKKNAELKKQCLQKPKHRPSVRCVPNVPRQLLSPTIYLAPLLRQDFWKHFAAKSWQARWASGC